MQILWPRITPVIPAVCFTIAISMIVATGAHGDQTIGTPMGQLTVTTPDPVTENWPNGKPHYRMRADQSYTAASSEWYQGGTFDPHGSVGIRRFFQTRTNGTDSLTPTMSEINVLTKDMPANSWFNQAQSNQSFGPYAPDQSTYTPTSLAANDVYGVETIELVFVEQQTGAQSILDYQMIDIYGPQSANVANFYVQNFRSQVALNTDTTKPYLGDPPRVTLTASNIYPDAKFWVVIYPGPAQTTPPAGAKTISSTVKTAPTGDNWTYPTGIYLDIGNYVTTTGTYTVQAMQQSTSNSQIGTEPFGSAASFSLKTNYNVTSQLGLSK